MIQGARLGCYAILLCAAFASGVASAQTAGGGQGEWVDPPVRGAASPPSAEAPKAATDNAQQMAKPPETPNSRAAEAKRAPHAAGLRRARIREAATHSRSRTTARSSAVQVRLGRFGRAPRQRVALRPRPYAYRAERWGNASLAPLPPYGHRRDGWGYLTSDGRAERIDRARAAGYLVMHSRSVAYPDGTLVRSLTPFGFGGPYAE